MPSEILQHYQNAQSLIEKIITLQCPAVILRGPLGSNTFGLARTIHDRSQCHGSFIAVHCGPIEDALSEEDYRAATDGTLYFDDISQTNFLFQRSLMQLLMSKLPKPKHLIAATTEDLELMTAKRRFLEELYFYLAQVVIPLPVLADFARDIPVFIADALKKLHRGHFATIHIDEAARQALESYPWSGLLELRLAMSQALVQSDGLVLQLTDLPHKLQVSVPIESKAPSAPDVYETVLQTAVSPPSLSVESPVPDSAYGHESLEIDQTDYAIFKLRENDIKEEATREYIIYMMTWDCREDYISRKNIHRVARILLEIEYDHLRKLLRDFDLVNKSIKSLVKASKKSLFLKYFPTKNQRPIPLQTMIDDIQRKVLLKAYQAANGYGAELRRLLNWPSPQQMYKRLYAHGIISEGVKLKRKRQGQSFMADNSHQ